MEKIKKLVEKIDDELEDAEKYIKLACKYKESDNVLADTFYKLSMEEMGHMTIFHAQVVRIIEDFKKTKEVPPGMQTLYDYLHERQIKWAAKIKVRQESYK